MDLWLVYLDNTNAPETVPFLFKYRGLQNVMLVKAPDLIKAKEVVLGTLRHAGPQNLEKIYRCLSGTKLNELTGFMNRSNKINLWSYIPMGGQQAPGQQANYPDPNSLVQRHRDENGEIVESSREFVPPRPNVNVEAATVRQEDLRGVKMTAEDKAVVQTQQPAPAATPPGMDAATFQQFQQFQAFMAMQNGGQPATPPPSVDSVPDSVPVTQGGVDEETLRRIQENATAGSTMEEAPEYDEDIPSGDS